MYRHSPSRHQKSKGFRLKHVLQICVLVGVCFWLIYQVKHSHDKRKQFDENDAKTSRDVEMNNAVLKLGRKDLISQEKGPVKDIESHDEEAEEEIVEEDKSEEENGEQDKNEEEIEEEDKHGEEIEKEDKHEEEIEEDEKHEEESAEEDKNEEETEEDKKDEEPGEEDKHEEEIGEEDKHEEENGEEDKHEEETGIEDEHEKGEQEEDIEIEEKGDRGRGGDDGVNEQEQEKTESDVNQEEEFLNEEKDKKDTNEKETEDKDDGGKDSQHSSIEDRDHDEGARNTREAREEQYKGDDASSAVTHDGQNTSTENVIGSMENQASTIEQNNKHDNTEEGGAGKNATDVNPSELEARRKGNIYSNEEKSSEVLDSISRGNSSLTSVTALESNGQSEIINSTDTQDSSVQNETEIIRSNLNSGSDGNGTAAEGTNSETLVLEQSDKSTVALHDAKLDSNSSSSTATENVEENPVESRDSTTNLKFVSSETLVQSNVSAENKDGSESTTIVESTDDGNENPENVEGTEGTYDNSDSTNSEDTDEVQHDSIDSSDISVHVDDKENRIDLDTLPDIRTEGSNSEEVAEE